MSMKIEMPTNTILAYMSDTMKTELFWIQIWWYQTFLTISIRIRLAKSKFPFFCPLTLLSLCPVGCLSLALLNWDSQQSRDLATSGSGAIKENFNWALYYEESLVSSNLNSKPLRFHSARTNVHTYHPNSFYIRYINTQISYHFHNQKSV